MGYEIDQVDDLLSGLRIGAVNPWFPTGRAPQALQRAPYYPPHPSLPGPYGHPGLALGNPFAIGNTALRQTMPTKDGQLILPMSSSGTVAAATTATITARPQIPAFRPERIVIANSIATFFVLNDIKVGNTSQLVQAGSIPAEAFIQGAFGVEMRMDTVQTAMDFVFSVTNQDATTARSFLAVVFGRSVY